MARPQAIWQWGTGALLAIQDIAKGELMMGIPRITPGLNLVDDEGDEVVVCDIDDVDETVKLEAGDGDSYSMSLRELRCKLRDGDFVVVEDDDRSDDGGAYG